MCDGAGRKTNEAAFESIENNIYIVIIKNWSSQILMLMMVHNVSHVLSCLNYWQ
jgi:hypothetical protein